MLCRDDAQGSIAKLQPIETRFEALGATPLYLFGSKARDRASAESDLDLFKDYDPGSRFYAFDLLRARYMIEDELGIAVDLAMRSFRADIEGEAVRVF